MLIATGTFSYIAMAPAAPGDECLEAVGRALGGRAAMVSLTRRQGLHENHGESLMVMMIIYSNHCCSDDSNAYSFFKIYEHYIFNTILMVLRRITMMVTLMVLVITMMFVLVLIKGVMCI